MRTQLPSSSLRRAALPVLAALAGGAGLFATDARAGGPGLPPGQELGTQPTEVDGEGFQDSDVCSNCHLTGTAIDPHMAGDTWAGTMMANSMRDPAFHASLAIANQDAPGIGTFCIRCHSPLAYVRGNATADPTGATSLVDDVDADGVSCEACHRANPAPADLELETPYLVGDGRLYFDDDATKRGPYVSCDDDPDDPECSLSPGHLTVLEPALGDAAFCGQCHQVTIPGRKLRDDRGAVTEHDFPLDTTYPEWAASDFSGGGPDAETCQGCHMVRTKDGAACNTFGALVREDIPQHGFVGGNHWGITAVMETNPDRAAAYPAAFETALARTLELLQTAATVTLLEVPEEATPGDTIEVRVRVENHSGHKFPTGYAESRRAWLQVAVGAESTEDVVVLGAYDAAAGEIVDPASTRVYRAEHGRWNGNEAVGDGHLVLHDAIVLDTRIPPKGFVPDATTMPKGPIDFANDDGGYDHFDEVTLTVTLPDDIEDAVANLRVDLVYQSMTRAHVAFLESENDTNVAGERLLEAFEATGEAPPLLVATAEQEIALPGNEGTGGGGGAGGGAGGSAAQSTSAAATTVASTASASSAEVGAGAGDPVGRGTASPSDDCGCHLVGESATAGSTRGAIAALGLVALGTAMLRRSRRRLGTTS